jgi:excinuclease ABC subunit A
VLVNRLSEIDTAAFRQFLGEAAASFQLVLKRMQTKPEDVMPWKLNGERWHLGEKGFPVGRKVRWDRAALPRLLAMAREVEPRLEVRWDNRDAITLKVPGVSRGWAQWRTKEAAALICRFLGKKGQFNLAQVEGVGVHPAIDDKAAGDVLRLHFQTPEQAQNPKLKQVLADHLRGFREVFGKGRD